MANLSKSERTVLIIDIISFLVFLAKINVLFFVLFEFWFENTVIYCYKQHTANAAKRTKNWTFVFFLLFIRNHTELCFHLYVCATTRYKNYFAGPMYIVFIKDMHFTYLPVLSVDYCAYNKAVGWNQIPLPIKVLMRVNQLTISPKNVKDHLCHELFPSLASP